MSEATKATIQSIIRLILNTCGGAWAASHPDIAGGLEASIPIVIAAIWTFIDNKKKNPPTGPERVTVTLG